MTSTAKPCGTCPLQTQPSTSLSVSSEPESNTVHLSLVPVRLESRRSTCTQHWLFTPTAVSFSLCSFSNLSQCSWPWHVASFIGCLMSPANDIPVGQEQQEEWLCLSIHPMVCVCVCVCVKF